MRLLKLKKLGVFGHLISFAAVGEMPNNVYLHTENKLKINGRLLLRKLVSAAAKP